MNASTDSWAEGRTDSKHAPVAPRSVGRGRELLCLAAVVGVFTVSLLPLLGRPFLLGHDGFNGAARSMGAANILRFGLVATRGGATREYWEELPRDEPKYYTSHPYGHPLLLAATYALFGAKERVGRSLSLAFCLALLWLLFVFGRQSQASIGGLAAAATAASLPMMHEYGPMVIGQIPSLPFVVTLYLLYFRILRTGTLNVGIAAATVLSILAAGLLDWHVFFHLPVLGIHFASRAEVQGRLRTRVCFTLALAASLPIVLFLAHTY